MLGRIVRRLRQGHEAGEVTLSELSVLSRLDREGAMPAGVIAEQERVSPQAMTTILAVLEERGLVARQGDVRDGRRASLSATASGETAPRRAGGRAVRSAWPRPWTSR